MLCAKLGTCWGGEKQAPYTTSSMAGTQRLAKNADLSDDLLPKNYKSVFPLFDDERKPAVN